jgi:hypothetical protein
MPCDASPDRPPDGILSMEILPLPLLLVVAAGVPVGISTRASFFPLRPPFFFLLPSFSPSALAVVLRNFCSIFFIQQGEFKNAILIFLKGISIPRKFSEAAKKSSYLLA